MATESLPTSGAIWFDNFIMDPSQAATITASTEETLYPGSNLLDHQRTIRWRSTGTTSTTLLVTLTTAALPTCVGFIDSNMDSGETVTIKSATDAGITSNVETWTFTTQEQSINGTMRFYLGDHNGGSGGTARTFWQITIPTHTPLGSVGYHEIGALWLGTYVDVTPSQVTLESETRATRSIARGGSVYSDEVQLSREIDFESALMTYADAYSLRESLESQGDTPVLVDLHAYSSTEAIEKVSAYYCRVLSSGISVVSPVENSVSMEFSEYWS